MSQKIHRIIVTGDILRPQAENFASSQTGNIRWLHALLKGVLRRATGKQVECLIWNEQLDIQNFYRKADADLSIFGWGDLSDRRNLDKELDLWLDNYFSNSFIIGFEMPRVICAAFSRLGLSYINCTIHPIRFLSDIYFGMSTNHPETYYALEKYAILEKDIYRGADIALAHVAKNHISTKLEARSLILGQVNYDRSLIFRGRFSNFLSYAEKLHEVVKSEENILFKKHPYSKGDLGLYLTGIPARSFKAVNHNLYHMMSDPAIKKVISISSGGSFEARYFEKEGIHLGEMQSPCVSPGTEFNEHNHLGIFEGFLDEDFWRSVLAPFIEVSPLDGDRYKRPPNTLRTSLGDFWGFNQITTDRIVRLCK